MTLSAFADEISPDLDTQLDVLEGEGISHIEFRGVWETNVLKLTDDQLANVKKTLDERGFRLSSIGSPIGKIGVNDDFTQHLTDFERAIEVAQYFDVPYIRIFSFFIPEGDDPAEHRDEVMRRMRSLVKRAEEADIVLLHENEKEIYGDTAERCQDLMETIQSPYLRSAFDPANFVQCGVKPYTDAFPLLADYIEYLHIKDASFSEKNPVPAGKGDGEMKEVLQAMQKKGYNGFMSLEPHLSAAGTFSGFSGPDLFGVAAKALKELLNGIGEQWN